MNEAGDPSANIVLVALLVLYWVLLSKVLLGNRIGTQQRQNDDKAKQGNAPVNQRGDCIEGSSISAAAISVVREVDRNFDAVAFLVGAESAYEMILQAYAQGDVETLKRFVGQDVFNVFEHAIEARCDRHETLFLTFIGMRKAAIVNALKKGNVIEIGVHFIADVVTATHLADGTVIAGDAMQIVEVVDGWTFAREVSSRSLDWKLVATGSF